MEAGTQPGNTRSMSRFPPVHLRVPQRGEKRELLGQAGAERVEILHFDREMAALEPEAFVRRYLIDALGMVGLVAGEEFALGRARIRTMPSAAHTKEDLDFALQAFVKVRDKLGVKAWTPSPIPSS